MRTWTRNNAFFLANLWICNLDWDTKEICGFAICGLIITNLWICDLRTGSPQKFADLRLRNEPKNLRTNKKVACPPLKKGGEALSALSIETIVNQHQHPTIDSQNTRKYTGIGGKQTPFSSHYLPQTCCDNVRPTTPLYFLHRQLIRHCR